MEFVDIATIEFIVASVIFACDCVWYLIESDTLANPAIFAETALFSALAPSSPK